MSHDPAERPGDGAEEADRATRDFAGHRELLFSVVYGLLGSVSDTEDVLRDTWLTWADGDGPPDGDGQPDGEGQPDGGVRADGGPQGAGEGGPAAGTYESGRARLLRIAVGRALARRTATVSTALHTVLETLPPLERAVFVLAEVFGYADADVAAILGRRPDAVRQLAHRARAHVRARRPPHPADGAEPHPRRDLTERFIAAATAGDLPALLALLAPDVTLWTDGGGRWAALRPVAGRERVARFLGRYAARHADRPPDVRHRYVGGDPSAVVFSADSPYAVLVMDLSGAGDQIAGIYLVTNPGALKAPRG